MQLELSMNHYMMIVYTNSQCSIYCNRAFVHGQNMKESFIVWFDDRHKGHGIVYITKLSQS
jgi:hypothetical protein